MSNETVGSITKTSKPEESAPEMSKTEERAAEANEAEGSAVDGEIIKDCPKDLMDVTLSGKIFPGLVVFLGFVMVLFAAIAFCARMIATDISAPEAAFFCTAFLAGSLLIAMALAMVFSRTAAERRIKDNWYKDQLDDYLAKKDRPSNNTRAQ